MAQGTDLLEKQIAADSPQAVRWMRNGRESPLLQLPAEVRLMIWTYVLGNYFICPTLSRYSKRKLRRFTYLFREHPNATELQSKAAFVLAFEAPLAMERTSLTHVCRQMYKEAALLPFTENSWHFDSAWELSLFITDDTKISTQRKSAIRVVVMQYPGPYTYDEAVLCDLRALYLYENSDAYHIRGSWSSTLPRDGYAASADDVCSFTRDKVSNMWVCKGYSGRTIKDLLPKLRKSH